MAAIHVEGLRYSYGDVEAVKGISFDVAPGEILGFLGPNGAGKSTTIKMLTGQLRPRGGHAEVLGFDVTAADPQMQARIGVCFEEKNLYLNMSGRENLEFFASLYEIRDPDTLGVLRRVGLADRAKDRVRSYSKGMRQRMMISRAFINTPDVLFLDEPTDGLDPNQKHQVRELIRSLASDRIVIVSTHILEEVSAVCSRALVIAGGRLVADATPLELQSRSRYHQAVTLLGEGLDAEALAALPGVAGVECNAREHSLTVLAEPGQVIFPQISALVAARGWPVREMNVERGRLDEVFRSLTRGEAA